MTENMARKTNKAALALFAAVGLLAYVGVESSGANAQQGDEVRIAAPASSSAAALSNEVIPANATNIEFISKPVVQQLPKKAEITDAADVLAETANTDASSDDSSSDGAEQSARIKASSLQELVRMTPKHGKLSSQMKCLAGAVYFESRGEPLEGQLAVAQVIVNRAESRRFPSDYCGVVYQRAQFSFVRGGKMPRINTGSKAWKRAVAIARIADNDHWDSKADDALYFHAKYVKPAWAKRKVARATISSHVFYR